MNADLNIILGAVVSITGLGVIIWFIFFLFKDTHDKNRVRENLNSNNWLIREAAVEGLDPIKDQEVIIQIAQNDTDCNVRQAATKMLKS